MKTYKKPSKPTVFIAPGQYDQSIENIIEEILTLYPANRKNSNILLKPNILGPHSPAKAVTTHPSLVKAVICKLKDLGAKVMVGDNPGMGGYGRSRKAADTCGLLECAGDCYVNLGLNPVQVKVNSEYFKDVTISKEILEADEVINLPKLTL